MANVFDYLNWRGDLTLEQSGFCAVDAMVLSRLAYAPFEYAALKTEPVAIRMAAGVMLAEPDIENIVLMAEDTELFAALFESRRFRDMQLFAYENLVEYETQFSAITVKLSADSYYIAFRGTDSTLVGWKEDFNMGFVCPVPAQELAVRYVETIAGRVKGSLMLGGHSKGGNLAVYAAAFCKKDIQSRITAVYNFDGPGFDEKVLRTEGYKRICDITETFVPQSSIVGMLLGHEEKYTIVHSTETGGALQHDTYSWEILRDSFVCLETVTGSSRFIDFTIKEWIANMDYDQRERFVDALFMLLKDTNAQTLHELSEDKLESAKTVLKTLKNLDEDTRKTVTQGLKLLMRSAKKGVIQMISNRSGD